jgi:hypothetical protein
MIEQKLADLQKRVANLEAKGQPKSRDAWKQIVGTSKGQKLDQEAARLGATWRDRENRRK